MTTSVFTAVSEVFFDLVGKKLALVTVKTPFEPMSAATGT